MFYKLAGVRLCVLALGTCMLSSAANPGRYARRLTIVALAAAETLDAYSTHVAVANGARELNPILSRNGHPLWGRIIGVKIGITGGLALGEELIERKSSHRYEKYWSVGNGLVAGPTMLTAMHNFELANKLKDRARSRAVALP